ncbi:MULTISPECIES: hypothetical protein [unclassified Microcystis]|nr:MULTISPECIES: hypothetical protein [unclassified Microcystis]MCZ8223923.1 hypothetical protein [Microcystis sp. LE19-84.1B]
MRGSATVRVAQRSSMVISYQLSVISGEWEVGSGKWGEWGI